MPRKPHVDAAGAVMLASCSALFALGQLAVKVGNEGFQPVFFAALRSAGAILCVGLWLRARGMSLGLERRMAGPALLIGAMFAIEFTCLFLSLDHNSLVRTTILFYTMPVWLAVAAHFLLPGERLTLLRALGLGLAFAGVAWALALRGGAGEGGIEGDLLALGGAMGWAGVALCARATPLRELAPDVQLFWQVAVSAPLLLLAALAMGGPLLRAPDALAWGALGFHTLVVASFGFIFWFRLLSVYPASGVASFGFLSPVFALLLGWAVLGEEVGPGVLLPAVLVMAGILLINRPARRSSPA